MDDLISREATLEAFADYVAHGMSMNDYDALEDIVIHMPSVSICTDAISRTDAIRVASGYCHWSNIPAELAKLPSVSTEKTGRWEWNQYDYNPNLGNWHCSECGSIVIECVPKKDSNGVPLYKYCPQCGCRLVEPQESEE